MKAEIQSIDLLLRCVTANSATNTATPTATNTLTPTATNSATPTPNGTVALLNDDPEQRGERFGAAVWQRGNGLPEQQNS